VLGCVARRGHHLTVEASTPPVGGPRPRRKHLVASPSIVKATFNLEHSLPLELIKWGMQGTVEEGQRQVGGTWQKIKDTVLGGTHEAGQAADSARQTAEDTLTEAQRRAQATAGEAQHQVYPGPTALLLFDNKYLLPPFSYMSRRKT
jgi:hypothetical protein